MASQIKIQSFNQLLGAMIRTIIANTPLNDVNQGSVLLTLLEAAAANDFENNAAILSLLNLLNIDTVQGVDLDNRAADYGLSRKAATKASGNVSLFNNNITKQSTNLYVIKPAPIAGQTVLFVNNTAGWAPTGTLYIGRGTPSFEGPIAYTSITVFPTFSQINLASALQNNHLISDIVVNSQGQPDRIIAAGTIIKIPANNLNPEIDYVTLRDAILPAGETEVSNVAAQALVAGSVSNAPINTIIQFDTLPFPGAGVSNPSAFTGGTDVETDQDLRNRIKSYPNTLARGTSAAILSAVIGVSDSDDSKQVASAVIAEPPSVGQPSILYIDDGTGFQPSYAGQSVDVLLTNATGKEQFLQLANYPVTRPQVINAGVGPFTLTNGSFLRVAVDGKEETVFFSTSDFVNITAAQVAEVVVAINKQSTTFSARLTNNSQNILLYPTAFDAEVIQVTPLQASDDPTLYANSILEFPVSEFSFISLYQNSTRLKEKTITAQIETTGFASWNITGAGNLILSVDGTPEQNRSFSLSNFPGATSFANLTLADWVAAFNSQFAGITATATSNQTMQINSNQTGSSSSLAATGGTLLAQLFPTQATSSVGQTGQFILNRQTGNLEILTTIHPGDTITAGTTDAKGFVTSTATPSGNYSVTTDGFGRPAQMIIVADSTYCNKRTVAALIGSTLTISNPSTNVMRIMADSLGALANLLPGDFVYMTTRATAWLATNNTGLFKIVDKGGHTTPGVDSYVDVLNPTVTPQAVTVADPTDIQAFSTNGYPQLWLGTFTPNPPVASISDVINSINDNIVNVLATAYQSDAVKITSTTEQGGSIAIPVVMGNATSLFSATVAAQLGNPPEVANIVSSKSILTYFKFAKPSEANAWLNRQVFVDSKGALTSDAVPDAPPYSSPYSETLTSTGKLNSSYVDPDNIIAFTRGNNRDQIRSIAALLGSDQVGTQQGLARTSLDHIVGDEFEIVEPMQLSATDTVVVVLDNNPQNNTININMARTGQINSGSNAGTFIPTSTEFSANDFDNQTGVDFSNLTVWGTTQNKTNFNDYAVWLRSHNWYASGGVGSGLGAMILRAAEYGPQGDAFRFNMQYPTKANQSATTSFVNTPAFTTFSYFFGSGSARPIALSGGNTITVTGPYPDTTTNFPAGAPSSGNYYDYTFSAGTFTSVVVGDVLSITNASGVSNANEGQFGVKNISGNTVRVFNPNGSPTSPGSPEIDTITTIADVLGTPTDYTITTVADSSGSLNGTYFIIHDTAGSVAVWINENGTAAQPSAGTNRYIMVGTVLSGDSANTVATKITNALNQDSAFTAGVSGNQITITNNQNGALANATAGTSGFGVATTTGTNNASLNGKYFLIYDDNGSVSVWFDVGNQGTPEPFSGATRSIRVFNFNAGASANTVALAIQQAINTDTKFTAGVLSNVVTITNTFDGNVPNASAGTSGFGVSSTDGSNAAPELIANPAGVVIFPLTGTSVSSIVGTINNSSTMTATAVGSPSLLITVSTQEESYSYAGNATALGYGHNPTSPSLRGYVALYDGQNWIKTFENANPNFTTKVPFLLQGVSTIYSMDTAPNFDVATNGELFKLIPTTVQNLYHHFTQKALSQLPIVATVDIADDRKNVQIRSNQLGSAGAIEFIGGTGNQSKMFIQAESEVDTDSSGSFLTVRVPAFPDTFNNGDIVMLQNEAGVQRLNRLSTSDTINVLNPSAGVIEYTYNPKSVGITSSTSFTIVDVSASYSLPSGYVWRWTATGVGVNFTNVNAGDLVYAFGSLSGWDQNNQVKLAGDAKVSGLPIINVNVGSNYFDVANPFGKPMSSTTVGSGTVQICPTPVIKWTLGHANYVAANSLSRTSGTVTVNCNNPHFLSTGDSVSIRDSFNVPDGVYTSITVTSASSFTFALAGSDFSETVTFASIIKSTLTPTRYRLQSLGYNNLVRLSRQDGQSPSFLSCGVAVDDYLVLAGTTFSSNNNGRFRVLAVDNDSIIFLNSQATDQLNTIRLLNNQDIQVSFTANTNTVTGVAGAFKYLAVGDWVKKQTDADNLYLQVISMNNVNPALATSITLGGNYGGSTNSAVGVFYNEAADYDKGVYLESVDDIAVYEGDAVVEGDTLFIQNIVDSNWFNVNNVGSFAIGEYGTEPSTYKPFIRVANSSGVAQTGVQMSVSVNGFYTIESLTNKFYSIRQVSRSVLDDLSSSLRSIYVYPYSRSYKFNTANNSSITHMGKLGYSNNTIVGIDGYSYYTGLLQKVQRIVDGFEPDASDFPGQRAVGSSIETLPPLPFQVNLGLNVITNEGVNLGDVSNNIKSTIINYVEGLGVGAPIILSQIIANVMQVKGVASVTFTNPTPSTQSITLNSNEKAIISANNISIA
jgi:uncharacterized phage protein gp47/JayE